MSFTSFSVWFRGLQIISDQFCAFLNFKGYFTEILGLFVAEDVNHRHLRSFERRPTTYFFDDCWASSPSGMFFCILSNVFCFGKLRVSKHFFYCSYIFACG